MSALEEWDEHFQDGLELYSDQYDPESDDRDPEEVCMEQIAFAEDYADDMMDMQEPGWDDDDDDDEGDSWNPKEENAEVEDMPGDNAFERAEAYDNWDSDAADG